MEEWEQMLGLKDMDSRRWRIMAVSAMDESSSLKALDALDSLFVNSWCCMSTSLDNQMLGGVKRGFTH